ncbi:MAG: ABC transporter substrate-binding protein, partial [Chloroflexi bacterium]|nr:ABC transporter substrate-binding protein [Chloroflexota bacterium]
MNRRLPRRRFLRLSAGVSVGLVGAAVLGCSEDAAPDAAATAGPGHRVRIRVAPPGAPEDAAHTRLAVGVLAGDVGDDGLDPLTRSLVYSRLFDFDPRTSSVYASLATEVEVIEPQLLRMRIREDVFFHPTAGGEAFPLTVDSVIEEFEAHRDAGVFVFRDVIESVESPVDADLLVRLRAPFSLLFEHLAMTSASIRGTGEYGGVRARLGSGPFLPLRTDGDALVLQASPLRHEDERPLLSEVHIHRAVQSGDLDALFVQGELDVREHPDAASRLTAHARRDSLEVARPRQAMRGLALSLIAPVGDTASSITAFRDDRVRHAISIALSRSALGFVDGAATSGPIGPAFAGDALPPVELDAHAIYQHNTEEAVALLSAAGYESLTFRLSQPDSPVMLQVGQRMVEQLAAAGIAALLLPRPASEFQTHFLAGDFEAAFVELDRMISPDIGLRLHTTGGLDGQRSPWGYSNPVYDAEVRD